MGRRTRDAADPRLTDAELEIMRALWDAGEADVHEVIRRLGDGKAYSTVVTMLRILEQKGFATSRAEGRRHVFAPATPRPRWESAAVAELVQRVFAGDAASLVRRLLDSDAVDEAELAEIRALLDGRSP